MADSIKRKDNKGRILRENEQQRADGRYMYTYKDPTTGKKAYIYSWKLERNDKTPAGKKIDLSLREKEKLIEKDLREGISYKAGGLTVLELVERYISIKTKVRPTTRAGYKTVINVLREDDLIRKNPFDFELAKVLINDSVKRDALTPKQERDFLKFIKEDEHFSQFYDGMFILFKTGLRISELCGLTIRDIDL